MYLFCSSYAHNVAANGKWIASVSATVRIPKGQGFF
jgi:hypothetical protein